MKTNAQIIAEELFNAGVRYVFGQPGGEVVELIEALAQQGIEFVLMGHEGSAALAAGVMGLATGIPGVCLATLGPGACNLALGIGDAYLDRHPLIALSARTAVSRADWFNHQNLRLNEMYAPISKASIALHGRGTAQTVQQAIALATQSPYGPVYLTLPGDVAAQAAQPGAGQIERDEPLPESEPALVAIEQALNGAKRPFVVLGVALDQAKDTPAIRHFLEMTGLPHADTPKTKGIADPNSPNYLGTYLSSTADHYINALIRQSDCILGIGYDPVETAYDWHLGDNYYGIVAGSTAYGTFQPSVEAIGDVGMMVQQLAERYDGLSQWQPEELTQVREQIRADMTPRARANERGLAPFTVAQVLRQSIPPNGRITVDTGQHKMLWGQAWRTDEPLTYFNSNGLSSMSTSLPGAIALSLLDRKRPIVCLTGDGGFNMTVQELETVQRLDIAPLIVVLCDQALSLIRLPQIKRGYASRGVDFGRVDWAKVAEGYGVKGLWVQSEAELQTAVAAWGDNPQAMVLAVTIDENLYSGNVY